jgi:hypothetical protein
LAIVCLLVPSTADARRKKAKKKRGGKSHKAPAKPTPADTAPTPDPVTSSAPPPREDRPPGKPDKPPVLDFTGLNFEGQLHTPQLLYFLDRANEELERASLERRSFIPEMVKSVDEDDL